MNLRKILGTYQIFILSLLFILIPFTGILIWYGVDKSTNPTITITESNIKRIADKGSGTLEDPYIIENRHIKTRQAYGMRIGELSSFLIIRNCTFEARNIGLSISYCYNDIDTSNINLRMLRIYDNKFEGCSLSTYYCYFLDIVNNSLNTNLLLSSVECECVTYVNNTFHNHGLSFYGSNLEFKNNKFISCTYVSLKSGENITFCYNLLENTSLGLETHYSYIHHNTFQDTNDYAIHISCWYYGDDNKTFNSIHHNNFINNIDPEGSSQAYDQAANNTWYDPDTLEGNYWSNYNGTGYYYIDGPANAFDPYPLLTPVEI